MNEKLIRASLQRRGLRAWQADFVLASIESGVPSCRVLLAPPGTGKTNATVALVAEMMATGPKRVLILAPRPLCEQWVEQLGMAELVKPVPFVTAPAFREAEANLPVGQSPWDAQACFVVSHDLARQRRIASSLSGTTWDIVIVDEAHRLATHKLASPINQLLGARAIDRILLLTAIPFDPLRFLTPFAPPEVTNWYGPMTEWDGSMVQRPRVEFHVLRYTRGPEEVRVLARLFDALIELEFGEFGAPLLAKELTARAASSWFAIEQSLLLLRRKLEPAAVGLPPGLGHADLGVEREASEAPMPSQLRSRQSAVLAIEKCLETLDQLIEDEKREALLRFIRSLIDSRPVENLRICVVSQFSDTARILSATFDDSEIPSLCITESTSAPDRRGIVREFERDGIVLIGTDAGLSEGIALPQVTHVIHYDLPDDPRAFEQRRGRFDRWDRTIPCMMYAMLDETNALPVEVRLVEAALAASARFGRVPPAIDF